MKDLDFDELDKAVNSLMTGASKTPSSKSSPDEETTLDITPTLSSDEPVSFDKLDSATAEVVTMATPANELKLDAVETITSMPAAAVATAASPASGRRGGRFMDVVHPSSDMKKATTTPTRSTSRQGVTIDPVMSTRPEAPRASTPFPVDEPVSEPTKEIIDEKTTEGGWPDPLEMTDFKDDVTPKEEEWNAPKASAAGYASEPAPLTSPFLPDTKVEKRPLGNGTSATEESASAPDLIEEPREDKTIDDPNAQLPADPGAVSQQLPEELQSDLMSVEADTHMGVPKTEATHPSDTKASETNLPEEPTGQATSPAVAAGPVSIPQQYHEEPSTGDQKSGSIYDTDTYHRPLDHPAKKKAGWMWVIWIILIVLVGAGIGAGVFFAFLS